MGEMADFFQSGWMSLEHESKLLQNAGFIIATVLDNPDGVTIITGGRNKIYGGFVYAN